MGRGIRRSIVVLGCWACLVGHAAAQPRFQSVPATSPDPNVGYSPEAANASPMPSLPQTTSVSLFSPLDSQVSFIESALPRNMLRTRFDFDQDNVRPMRNGYLYSPQSLPLPERRIDTMTWTTMVEIAPSPWLSVFVDQPMRWLNPDVNEHSTGFGDTAFGFKYVVVDTQQIVASILLRASMPTGAQNGTGINQWTIEPGLLLNYRPTNFLIVEGELRYWAGLGGGPYAGDLVRYGAGLAYGQRNAKQIWVTPIVEAQGWTMASGGSQVVLPSGLAQHVNTAGETIFNGSLGVRVGLGANIDFFLGASRAFTGEAWSRETYRVEMRFLY